MASYDVIIVGLGAMGSSAAMHLAKRGRRVLGIDRFSPPHEMGSHHGATRMIRMLYSEHPGYVPLLRRSYELWRELEAQSGESILKVTGGVYIGRADSEFLVGAARSAHEHGLDSQTLSHPELSRRFPQFRVPGEFGAVIDPYAGFLLPARAIGAHLALASRHGAKIHNDQAVIEWTADAHSVRVRTVHGEYTAGALVLAAGAWMPRLAPVLAEHLRVTRQTLAWIQPGDGSRLGMGMLPVWALTLDGASVFYGFPMTTEGGAGFKVAHHAPGSPADPDALDRPWRAGEEAPILEFVRHYMPEADGPFINGRVCMYTSTPDQHFIIDWHPDHAATRNVLVASPCSGHGFKFASTIGEVLAKMLIEGRVPKEAEFLGLGRL